MKKNIIYTIAIFLISVLIHSFYELLPNNLTAIFFPVNESIWEHMKMIATSYILFLLIKFTFNKYENKDMLKTTIAIILNIIIFLIIYLPIYNLFGEHLVVTLIIYFITIFISIYLSQMISLKIKNKTIIKYSFIPIIILYIIFSILTHHPIKSKIFYDEINNIYGIHQKYD